jgi:hypothetical protein
VNRLCQVGVGKDLTRLDGPGKVTDMNTTEIYETTCCTDCLCWIANGDAPLSDPATGEPMDDTMDNAWTLAWYDRNDGYHWFPSSWPLPDGEEWSEDDRNNGADCEGSFSWSSCNLCGSTLGGDRYPVAGWKI